ncbi:MAG: peptidoglycan editing factor PgeF [Lachnospiraceae bacterium]|nr:peptidoglycan editing factor PgeF [Lachnospiraceae bacterium]
MKWTKALLKRQGIQLKQSTTHKSYEQETRYHDVSLVVQEGVPLLRFACFAEQEDWMGMAFSTRLGGISTGHLAEMNLGWKQGDSHETVWENYKRICQALGVETEKLVFSDQIHETTVEYVTKHQCAGAEGTKKLVGVDGLYTDQKGITLATSYADCVPLFFADPVQKVIASSHSGWRGTVGQIGRITIEKMKEKFACKPENILALVGPSICQNCYEVSQDVGEQFVSIYPEEELAEILEDGRAEGKYQLDLWAACYYTIKKAGVPPENIQVSRVCTCCQPDLLFSHRATQGKRGNLNGFIFAKAKWKYADPTAPECGW